MFLKLKNNLNDHDFCIESLFEDRQTVQVLDISGEKKMVSLCDVAEIIEAMESTILTEATEANA